VDVVLWQIFIYALPITALAMLIFNSIWNEGSGNFWIVSFQVISLLVAAYVGVLPLKNSWQLFLLVLPAELLVYLAFRIKK
jgi:general stress protein CsbA